MSDDTGVDHAEYTDGRTDEGRETICNRPYDASTRSKEEVG